MKKIIFILILFFVFTISTYALSKFSLGEKVPNMHIESVSENDVHNGIPFILRKDDGKFVYCLNPFQQLNTTDYYTEYSSNAKRFNITDEQLNKMNLIAYYGYNYTGHTDLKWYGVTQFLIWKTLNLKDIYFTDTKDGNKIIAYQNELKEVETLVNNHSKLPSIANKHYEYTINSTYELKDSNKVLYSYEIEETNIDAKIVNNKLVINTKKAGNYKIKFIKKSPITRDYKLYYLSGAQSLLYPGKVEDITFELTLEVNSGSITINKNDSENKERLEATLEGAVYGIYNDSELITTLKTNKEGISKIDNLPLGKYYVKEITPSVGYKLDEKTYEVNMTKENKNIIINSYEDIIKGNLIINKYYGDNSYELEDNAIFEIYDINNNLIGEYKTENGIINIELPYGNYYIVQKSGVEGYKFVENQYISILEEKDYILNLYNDIIKGNLIINKYYGDNSYELEDNAIFEIYDINDNLVGEYKTENGLINIELSYGDYYIIQKNGVEGYKFIEKQYFSIREEIKYQLDLYNKLIKSNLTINKYYGSTESYELEDDAKFEIYDINNNLIGEYETENGTINIKELPYGIYYIVQKSGIEGYKFVEKQYISILEEKDYILNLYNDIIKGNLIINKYYGNNENYELEDNAKFEIYDINNNLIGEYETKNGVINIELPYGDYYLLQIEGIEGYKFVDRIDFFIKEEKDYIYDLYNEKELIVVEVPDTSKFNYNKYVSIFLILLGSVLIIISNIKKKVLKNY